MLMTFLWVVKKFDSMEDRVEWFIRASWLPFISVILMAIEVLFMRLFGNKSSQLPWIIAILNTGAISIIFDMLTLITVRNIHARILIEKYEKLENKYENLQKSYVDLNEMYSNVKNPGRKKQNYYSPHSNVHKSFHNIYDEILRDIFSGPNGTIKKYPDKVNDALNTFGLSTTEDYTIDHIKSTYRMLMLKYHPDRPGGSTEMARKINDAYAALKEYENYFK